MSDDAADYEELKELGNAFVAQPQSRDALAAMKKARAEGASKEEMLAISREHLTALGMDGKWLLEQLPEEMRDPMTPQDQADVVAFFDGSIANMLMKADGTGETPALLGDIVEMGGIVVDKMEIMGQTVEVVRATIFPFINPEKQIARLIETCYRVYPQEAFARPKNGLRDSKWYRRHLEGETYRQIALSDPRSGITPEAIVNPGEYRDEIERGTRLVAKAVQRFHKRWTQKPDPVSPDS